MTTGPALIATFGPYPSGNGNPDFAVGDRASIGRGQAVWTVVSADADHVAVSREESRTLAPRIRLVTREFYGTDLFKLRLLRAPVREVNE